MSEYIEHNLGEPNVGLVAKQYFTFAEPPDAFVLESGATLSPVTLAYETYGELAPERDNAVLVTHALTGDAHVAGYHDEADPKPGWWDIMVGPGKAIDTDKYFVICSNILGGCSGSTGPASVNPETDEPYGLSFPMVSIGDMVRAQKRLVRHLGITRLLAATGGSMGGMQVLEWSLRYPDMVAAALPLAATARHSALNIAFHEIARQSIMADPNWRKGAYPPDRKPELGLAVARMVGHVTYLSDEAMRRKFGRNLYDRPFSFSYDGSIPDFQIESYLRYQGRKFVDRFDANSFLYITKAADFFDLAPQHGRGSLVDAFARARARFLVVSFSSDWLYPTAHSREMVQAMKKAGLEVSFCEIHADCGHDAFLLRNERLMAMTSSFLGHARDAERLGAL